MKLRAAMRRVVVPTLQAKVNPRKSMDLLERSQSRWKNALPDEHLTLGRTIPGTPFIEMLAKHCSFTESTRVVEIGPGYGRLLRALLESRVSFCSYTGIDLSPTNVAYLTRTFGSAKVSIVNGSARDYLLGFPFDVAYASLTFQHFYPTFQPELQRILGQAAEGAKVVFDVPERRWYHPFAEYWSKRDGNMSYIRVYSKQEATSLVEAAGGRLEAFDSVAMQDGEDLRLVVVCGRPIRAGTIG